MVTIIAPARRRRLGYPNGFPSGPRWTWTIVLVIAVLLIGGVWSLALAMKADQARKTADQAQAQAKWDNLQSRPAGVSLQPGGPAQPVLGTVQKTSYIWRTCINLSSCSSALVFGHYPSVVTIGLTARFDSGCYAMHLVQPASRLNAAGLAGNTGSYTLQLSADGQILTFCGENNPSDRFLFWDDGPAVDR